MKKNNGQKIIRIKLAYKLFGAFFLILVIVVGAIILSWHLSFRNFRNYVQHMEQQKLNDLVPALQEEYSIHDSWEGVRENNERWHRLLNIGLHIRLVAPAPPPNFERLPANKSKSSKDIIKYRQPREIKIRGPMEVILMDAHYQPIIGMSGPDDKGSLVAIEVDGRIVGWLGINRREPFQSGPTAAFLNHQSRQFFLLGAIVIGLTTLLAFIFSRHFIRPVKMLIQGTQELANRNFAIRIKTTTSDELGLLAENFNTMARALEQFEGMRLQWLTDISHELRTPLSVLRCEIEAVQDGVHDPTPENLESLHAEILRISRLVEDLYLLSNADSDRLFLKKQRILPIDVLESIVENYRPRFARRKINIDLELGSINTIYINGDADRLGQVFVNILDNACKYVNPSGTLKITGMPEELFFTLHFKDSGPGVPQTALPRLFDRLYRVDVSRSRDSGGSGLGLSICRQIIEDHGGMIWAEQSPMGGLSIVIRLPLTE